MKKSSVKRLSLFLIAVLLSQGMSFAVAAKPKVNGGNTTYHYADTSVVQNIPDKSGCTSMQGLNVGTRYAYTVKYQHEKDANGKDKIIKQAVIRTDLDNPNITSAVEMNYLDQNGNDVDCTTLHHANDITVFGTKEGDVTVNYMFVATLEQNPAITCLRIEGTSVKLRRQFTLKKPGGGLFSPSAIKQVANDSTNVYFLIKSGDIFYGCAIPKDDFKHPESQSVKQITCHNAFTIVKNGAEYCDENGSVRTVNNSEWTNQGFGYSKTENAIYVPITKTNKKNENLIIVYKNDNIVNCAKAAQSGDLVLYPSNLSFYMKKDNVSLFEIESCGFRTGQNSNGDNRLYFNVNESGGDKIYRVNYSAGDVNIIPGSSGSTASDVKYTVKYNANGGSGSMNYSSHIRGVNKNLSKNTFTKSGNDFAGWYLERKSDGKQLFVYNGSTRWYTLGEQPAGAYLALYEDCRQVSMLTAVNNDEITCYAQWKPKATGTKTFYIRYNANGGSGAQMADTKAVYGQNTTIANCKYTRSGYEFGGWIAHRTSDNKFLYKSNADLSDSWRNPTDSSGYFLKAYNAGSTVAKTSSVDRDIITFYAVWIKAENVKAPKSVRRGNDFAFGGTIESDAGLYRVNAEITNPFGKVVASATSWPKTNTYNIANLNSQLHTSDLKLGVFKLTITVTTMNTTSNTTSVTVHSSRFIVTL